jgi:hypothetical protein
MAAAWNDRLLGSFAAIIFALSQAPTFNAQRDGRNDSHALNWEIRVGEGPAAYIPIVVGEVEND